MSARFIYLVKVEPGENNNKFYRMIEKGPVFTAEWGRIGNEKFQTKDFPINKWDSKLRDKLRDDYVDKTSLIAEQVVTETNMVKHKPIANEEIAEIVKRLQTMAKDAIKANYTVSADKVTQAMIDEAERFITKLYKAKTVNEFNEYLTELFKTIPRKMKNVRDNLLKNMEDISEIIKKEEDLLDVMKGQVAIKSIEEKSVNETSINETILEVLGIEIQPVDETDIKTIKQMLGDLKNNYNKAWKVINLKTQKRFDEYISSMNNKNKKLLWHGSRNENWWSILRTGLLLKSNAIKTASMFGKGIYFAPLARKSFGYTSFSGSRWANGNSKTAFMALFETAYGTPFDVYKYDSKYGSFNYKKLQEVKANSDCLHAHAGCSIYNDEIIYFKEEQITIKYLVELK